MTWKEKAGGPLPSRKRGEKTWHTTTTQAGVSRDTHWMMGSINTWQCSISLSSILMVRRKVNKCWTLVRTPHLNLKVNLFTVPNCPYSAPNLPVTPVPIFTGNRQECSLFTTAKALEEPPATEVVGHFTNVSWSLCASTSFHIGWIEQWVASHVVGIYSLFPLPSVLVLVGVHYLPKQERDLRSGPWPPFLFYFLLFINSNKAKLDFLL